MRIDRSRESENVEDQRGLGPPRRGGLKLGIGGTLVALVAAYFLGIDPRLILGLMQAGSQVTGGAGGAPQEVAPGTPTDAGGKFVAAVLGDTEDTWGELFSAGGAKYVPPHLVLFSEATQSGCGAASSGAGPFYCPADRKVYIDLAFYDELEQRFQAPGDFAKAYVLAHEVGHHVQTLLGTSDKVRAAQERGGEEQSNALQVRMELQADCYAGIWANHANRSRQILEAGDVEEALGAAAAVGDDTLQKRMQGYVVPESFTHGSAQQRMQWFKRGLDAGTLEACDTFASRG
ncbi:MAG: neutral zinc metallopeptidase [Steroidobacteraceae bacterium]